MEQLREPTRLPDVLACYGGQLALVPLVTAVRRHCHVSREDAELLVSAYVEAGALVVTDGCYATRLLP